MSLELPAPDGTAITVTFTDGHVEHIRDEATVDELVAAALAKIGPLEAEHGALVSLTPSTGRFSFVSPATAERLRAQGVDPIDTSGMDRDEFLALLPTLNERWK